MSLSYAETRIKEALKQAKGNALKARQQVITWALQDAKLLAGLTKNHLNGIVAYHVDRVASGRAEKNEITPPLAPALKSKAKESDVFGMELLKAVVDSGTEVFGFENSGLPLKRGQASQRHIDAMKSIASKTIPSKKRD